MSYRINNSLTNVMECNSNITLNVSEADDYISTNSYADVDELFITKIFPIILVFGVLNNGIFLFVLYRVHRMRTTLNALLASLAISDILFLILAVGEKTLRFSSSTFANDVFPFSAKSYTILQSFIELTFQASLIAITTVAYERYNVVCHPTLQRESPTRKVGLNIQTRCIKQRHLVKLLCFIWGTGLFFSILFLPPNIRYCHICIEWPPGGNYTDYPTTILEQNITAGFQVYYNISQGIPFIVAFFLNSYFYFKLIRVLKKHTQSVCKEHTDIVTRRRQRKQRITHMLLINSAVYFVCLAPYMLTCFLGGIVGVWNSETASKILLENNTIFTNLSRTFMYLNSAVNSLLYTTFSVVYRTAYVEALCFKKAVNHDNRISELRSI
ncbi:neuromedin-U receptor 2-like [Antedon mediterranea]|uniref:neuromedin-U receptor 2-like n=1 Tax=Antedon mediterranea TaxID=105859 RepID=UPI003AF818F2